jgi:hypothetical protein
VTILQTLMGQNNCSHFCSGSAKNSTRMKAHKNRIRITTWRVDHVTQSISPGRGQTLPIPKCASKQRTIHVSFMVDPMHMGSHYAINPNILLFKHWYINPYVWDICTSNYTLFITSFKYQLDQPWQSTESTPAKIVIYEQ